MNPNDLSGGSEAAVPVLEATDLRKTFRDFWGRPRTAAVRGVSLAARKGEVVGLLGPNGSGKSTTIKMLLGLVRPTGGKIRIFGKGPREKSVRARIGYLPELSHLHPFLTPRETLRYAAALLDMPRSEANARIERLLKQVGLAGVAADRRVGEFSKGMARRVGLARALLGDPQLVVLDEPTSGLDPVGRREVKDLVIELGASGKTVLMSSHLLAEVEDTCSRVAVLVQGRIRAEGALSDLLAAPGRATRFEAEGLPETAVPQALDALRALGAERVKAGKPTRQLEEFFLGLLDGAEDRA